MQDHAFYRNIKKLKKCIDRGDDLNGPNEEGNSALHWAIEKGHVKAVEALLAAGADIEIENTLDANNTALMLASQYGLTDITKVLLAHDAEWDHQDAKGRTALAFALKHRYPEIIKLLQTIHRGK
ncbi:ankyrin repeat domain-containing protein [Exiguobacterium sp. ERU656]|uniref:ankyrin repeat domain-containing protein n=1 Tax=Exiguobacterium sp. ERU656 TaxID=2751217 RepID=UPI003338B1D9